MSNSSLVNYTQISPNSSNPRNGKISKITIHHMAGNLTVEQCGNVFANKNRQASANYGIGTDGRVGLYVDEANRSWATSSRANDNIAVTIEVANDVVGGNWHVSDKALSKLIDLCTDICKRNGIKKLNFTGDASGNLNMHRYFAATACPGDYLASKFPYIADEVNKRLSPTTTKAENTENNKNSEDLTMEQYKELKKEIDALKAENKALRDAIGSVYKTEAEIPDYYMSTIKPLIDKGAIKGVSEDNLNLPEVIARTIVIINRDNG